MSVAFRFVSVCLAAVIVNPNASGQSPASQRSLNDLTGPWQLFIDDYLIASRDATIERVYHAFEKYPGNPIMVADQPWENNVVVCNTVLPEEDGSGYRMWYYCWSHKNDPDKTHACYAVSKDGIHWEKPILRLKPWKVTGTLDTNFVGATGDVIHTPWDPDPSRRYKCIGGGGEYKFSCSPDGIHWQRLSQGFIVKGGDTGTFMWDPFAGKFRAYVKVNATVSGLRRRAIGYSEGSTFENWPGLRLIMAPDDLDDTWAEPGSIHRSHFYGCPMFPYQTMYIGLMWLFRADRDDDGYFFGPVFNELVFSRDAIHWNRAEPGPHGRPRVLDVGPTGTWESGMSYAGSLIRVGDTLRLYYTAASNLHDTPPFHGEIGLATMRKDGFVSLDAAYKPGTITTKRLTGLSGELHVNYRAWGGKILVEVLDAHGQVVPGYGRDECTPLQRDSVDAVVTWRHQRELPAGDAPRRLRFVLDKASLFSFSTGDNVQVLDEPAGPTLGVLFTFEGDKGRNVTDKLTRDGVSTAIFHSRGGRVEEDKNHAAFGENALNVASPFRPVQSVEISGTTDLGKAFTLAAMIKSADNKPARIFSAYNGNRPVNCSELVFDCDPRGRSLAGLRLICKGIAVESDAVRFDDNRYHHVAVTFDDGAVQFFLDGKPVGQAWLPGGAGVTLARNLRVGEDAELGSDEQFMGHMDDVLVLGQALNAKQIAKLATQGAEPFLRDGMLDVPAE
ncbi:MAG TPA: hypothetical protein PK458_03285 [Phycisphaerae bacterium]|nr:hypothetical protein [Phycisphaerae bacterium]